MVVSVPLADAKVAYQSGRLHKNTLGRGRLWVRFRTINRASATLRAGTPTNLPSPQRDKLPSPQVKRGIRHMARSVRIIRTEVPRVPRDVFVWRRLYRYTTLASVQRYGIDHMVNSVPLDRC